MHIKAKACTAQRTLEHKQSQKCFQHSLLGEEANQKGEWACKIICINTHKFSAQLTGKGIKQVRVSANKVAQCLKEPNVLTVEVKYQNGRIAKWMQTAGKIHQINQRSRNEQAQNQVAVFFDERGACQPSPRVFERCHQITFRGIWNFRFCFGGLCFHITVLLAWGNLSYPLKFV